VILAERVDEALHQELRERLGALWNDRQVLLRSGTPLRIEHLERVAFRGVGGYLEANTPPGVRLQIEPQTPDPPGSPGRFRSRSSRRDKLSHTELALGLV
jgi:hypothetical protein